MIDRARLLKDLQKQVTEPEKDLREQLGTLSDVEQCLQAEYRKAFQAGRTSKAPPATPAVRLADPEGAAAVLAESVRWSASFNEH